jgi:hypothetical protein
MGWPQYAYLVLTLIGLGVAMEQHGQPKTGTHSFPSSLFATALILWILWEGGFFK